MDNYQGQVCKYLSMYESVYFAAGCKHYRLSRG